MSNKESIILKELYKISNFNKTNMFETLKLLDILDLIENKRMKKFIYINTLEDNIIKYFYVLIFVPHLFCNVLYLYIFWRIFLPVII